MPHGLDRETRVLFGGFGMGESPRWHDGRLWFSNWTADDVVAVDLDGNEVSIEADEFLARVFLHEVDHLDGVLLLERLEPDQRKQAMRALRDRALGIDGPSRPTPHHPDAL